MQHQFEGRARIIGVASRDTIEQIEAFVADTGVDTFPHAADIDGDVWEHYSISSQPAFVFINDDGAAAMGLPPSLASSACACSRHYFKARGFFDAMLDASRDAVPNVRLQLCALLPALKRALRLPGDDELRTSIYSSNFLPPAPLWQILFRTNSKK